MKRFLPALLCALLAATPSVAATKITGETKARVGELVQLVAETDVKGAALTWDVFGAVSTPAGPQVVEVSDEKHLYENPAERRLIFSGDPGTYWVKCRAISFADGKTVIETARATVTIGDAPPPGPGPGPGPTPPVPPAPVARGPLWVVAVVDNNARTPAVAKILEDRAMQGRLAAAGHRWKEYDPAAPGSPVADPAWKPFIAEAGGVPCLVILDAGSTPPGKRLKAVKMPADSASIEALVKELTGK
jgi:hypothetical protein